MRKPSGAPADAGAAKWLEVIADPVRLGILRSLSELPEATTSDLAERGQASSQTLRRHLEALVSVGVVRVHPAQSDGETPGRPAARFSLSSEIRQSVRAVFEPAVSLSTKRIPATAQAVGRSLSPAAFASTRSIAAVGPMNGASAK